MSNEPTPIAPTLGTRAGAGSLAQRGLAVIEVLAAFALVHVGYRSFKHFTQLGKLEGAAGLNFSPGIAMILLTLALLIAGRRCFEQYGLTLKGWRYNPNLGLLWGLLIVVVGGTALALSPVQVDLQHPPDVTRAVVVSFGELVLALLLLVFLVRERSVLRRVPPLASLLILVCLLCLPLAVAIYYQRPILNVLLTVLWLFFGAGFGEEIFFRGYIQSRLNQAFGRPFKFLGMEFGVGLLVSSLLFGFVHVLNTVDYFHGRFDFAWLWWGSNFASGFFFGCMRERTGSILPGAIVHGLEDVLGRIPSLLP